MTTSTDQADAPQFVESKPQPNYPAVGDVAEVTAVVVNEDGSGYVALDGGRYLNFEASPGHVAAMLLRRTLTLTSQTVLLGTGVKPTLIAYRDTPKRIRFANLVKRSWEAKR